ncbi:hypothetical protein [Nonomuraea salmonea]|uniref:hypothetical protein n=1 Tax=Nonomuraea salmonea TaxID=46181 RepID=UPI0031EE813F
MISAAASVSATGITSRYGSCCAVPDTPLARSRYAPASASTTTSASTVTRRADGRTAARSPRRSRSGVRWASATRVPAKATVTTTTAKGPMCTIGGAGPGSRYASAYPASAAGPVVSAVSAVPGATTCPSAAPRARARASVRSMRSVSSRAASAMTPSATANSPPSTRYRTVWAAASAVRKAVTSWGSPVARR